jgi:hypothetical protein
MGREWLEEGRGSCLLFIGLSWQLVWMPGKTKAVCAGQVREEHSLDGVARAGRVLESRATVEEAERKQVSAQVRR